MKPGYAFDICHEVYVHAREVLDRSRSFGMGTLHPEASSKYQWRPDVRPKLVEFVADFTLVGQRALDGPRLGTRLILFRLYYCGGAEYHAARRHLGISELTWANWAEEVRQRVGTQLLRAGVFPPGRYFKESSRILQGLFRKGEAKDSNAICAEPKKAGHTRPHYSISTRLDAAPERRMLLDVEIWPDERVAITDHQNQK